MYGCKTFSNSIRKYDKSEVEMPFLFRINLHQIRKSDEKMKILSQDLFLLVWDFNLLYR